MISDGNRCNQLSTTYEIMLAKIRLAGIHSKTSDTVLRAMLIDSADKKPVFSVHYSHTQACKIGRIHVEARLSRYDVRIKCICMSNYAKITILIRAAFRWRLCDARNRQGREMEATTGGGAEGKSQSRRGLGVGNSMLRPYSADRCVYVYCTESECAVGCGMRDFSYLCLV